MKNLIILLLMVGLFIPANTNALELDKAINDVVETNPEVMERLENFAVIQKDYLIAFADFLPSLDVKAAVGEEITKNQSTNFQSVDDIRRESSITLTQEIFTGFDTVNSCKKQKERIRSAAYATIAKANEIGVTTAAAYLELMKQKALFDLSEEKLNAHVNINDKVKERMEYGVGTKSELEQSNGRLALAQSNVIVHQNNFEDALIAFRRVYGSDMTVDVTTFALPGLQHPLPINLEESKYEAMKTNPAIIAQRYTLNAVKYDEKISSSDFYPKLYFELSKEWKYDIGGIEGKDTSSHAMLKASMNLFNGFATTNTVKKHRARIKQEAQILANITRQVEESLKYSWMAYTLIKKQIGYLEQHQDYSKTTLESYNEEFKLGRRTLLDILNTEEEYFSAQRELTIAEHDHILAQYRILGDVGTLMDAVKSNIKDKVELAEN